MKPMIKYRGGKSREIQSFQKYIPSEYDRFFEPFLGGGAVYFYLEPESAVINDINLNVIDFYRDTTNAIESLNATYRKLNRQRSVFPSDQALLKALYLSTFEATKKWTMPLRNWGRIYGELQIMYEGRLPE